MKTLQLYFLIIVLLLACQDKVQPLKILNGKIYGEDWELNSTKGNLEYIESQYAVEFFGKKETDIDPCNIYSVENYLSLKIPNKKGIYYFPFNNNQETLKFNKKGVGDEFLIANQGYVEVTTIEGRRIGGYLEAFLDDNNKVEGFFTFNTCN